jgi:hypothetical protein
MRQSESSYPPDLIQLWENHRYVSTFAWHLRPSTNQSSPTSAFDPVYAEILGNHPDLLFVLKALTIRQHDLNYDLHVVLRILGCSYWVFSPFLHLREQLKLPFRDGDSPLAFLKDSTRAGELYSEPQEIVEELLLLWIQRANEGQGSDFWLHP